MTRQLLKPQPGHSCNTWTPPETQSSFFHKHPTFTERVKASTLRRLYHHGKKIHAKTRDEALYSRFINHPSLTLDAERFKADHSKYYVIDEKELYLGGINVEDKENGIDREGRAYQDYMVCLKGEAYVNAFFEQLATSPKTKEDIFFGFNDNVDTHGFFMEKLYLDLIEGAERELYITMAYFSPCKRFLDAILRAVARGVAVTVLVPEKANFQSDSNLKTVKTLFKRSRGAITVCLSPKMVHTKLIASEKQISLGSTNITKKAFSQLSELNLFIKNADTPFSRALLGSVRENHALSKKVTSPSEIRYKKVKAFIEGFLV